MPHKCLEKEISPSAQRPMPPTQEIASVASASAADHPGPEPLGLSNSDELEYEIIPGRLNFMIFKNEESVRRKIVENPKLFFFSSDHAERYCPFNLDFGPVSLGELHEGCEMIRNWVSHPKLKGSKRIPVFYCYNEPHFIANSAFIACSCAVLHFGLSPEEAVQGFQTKGHQPFPDFCDASKCPADFLLTLLDCLKGLQKAWRMGWYDPENFDLASYDDLSDPENGDISQICPKFVVTPSPVWEGGPEHLRQLGFLKPKGYHQVFKQLGVSAVVRLSDQAAYDAEEFESAGVAHYDLALELEGSDAGSIPHHVVERFNAICCQHDTVAVHCRTGLGRSATLVALWLIAHHGFSAKEAIGWLRIVRPGSVLGAQQHFLEAREASFRAAAFSTTEPSPVPPYIEEVFQPCARPGDKRPATEELRDTPGKEHLHECQLRSLQKSQLL